MAEPHLRVASDVGGTFTDNLAYDEAARRITVAKVPTTPDNRALGTVAGLQRALALQGKTGADVAYVGHVMTTATNAIIQRTGGRTAFITNEGFRDLLDRPAEPPEPRGRQVSGTELRETVLAYPYIIRYRVEADRVIILRVRHGRHRPTNP